MNNLCTAVLLNCDLSLVLFSSFEIGQAYRSPVIYNNDDDDNKNPG